MDSERKSQPADDAVPSAAAGVEAVKNRGEIRTTPSLGLAILGGLLGAAIGAALWGAVALATGWRVIGMAIVVGLVVGGAVRLLGRGRESTFGGIGAIFALIGCAAGQLLMFCDIAARLTKRSFFTILADLDPMDAISMFDQALRASDLIFYAVAVAVAFLLSFWRPSRKIH